MQFLRTFQQELAREALVEALTAPTAMNEDEDESPGLVPVNAQTLGEIADPQRPWASSMDRRDQDQQILPAIQQRLKQGADPNDPAEFKQRYRSIPSHRCPLAPLYSAAWHGLLQVADALMDAGADLGWKEPEGGCTALHAATLNGDTSMVRSLVARGGQVDARNNNSRTPLHLAAVYSRKAIVQVLLEAGADASVKNKRGDTALDLAVSNGDHKVAECIRQADEAQRLCGAQQRLAFATGMLPPAEATSRLGELPFDVLLRVGDAVVALGPPAVRLSCWWWLTERKGELDP